MSVCLVCAMAAVLAPIMILAGLKFGFIEILRSKFIQDPSVRLITPIEAQIRPDAFFAKLRLRSDVAFVQPNVNLSGTTVRITAASGDRAETFDLMPTAEGDPLIVENEGITPGPEEVTLTGPGAEALGVSVGDEVKIVVFRSLGKNREWKEVFLKVRSVLRVGADAERRAYVALGLVQDIESYRAGITVSRRGWFGPASPPQQSFDAAYLLLESPLDEVELHTMCVRYGFATCRPLDDIEAVKWIGPAASAAAEIVQLGNGQKSLRGQQLSELVSNLQDQQFWLLPVANELRVVPANSSTAIQARSGLVEAWPPWRGNVSFVQVQRVLIPTELAQSLGISPGDRIRLQIVPASQDDATNSLTVTVAVDNFVEGQEIVMHPALVGMLLQARHARLAFDETLGTLLAADIGLRGFRLYARTIDDVPVLARDLQREGTEVRAKAEAIEQLQRLDAALTRIILVIAAVALVGGTAVLIASIYAAVERKKGDLALLRLLGFSRGAIFSFPILQSMMLATAGFLTAIVLFEGFATLINEYYATDLTMKGNVCRLETGHLLAFAFAIFGISLASSLVAARRAMQIDPAEALRHE